MIEIESRYGTRAGDETRRALTVASVREITATADGDVITCATIAVGGGVISWYSTKTVFRSARTCTNSTA